MPRVAEKYEKQTTVGGTWELSTDGTLTVKSNGAMAASLTANDNTDGWRDYKDYIKKVVIQNADANPGVTSISDNAFTDCKNLKEVVLPDASGSVGLVSIGSNAFDGCSSLTSIHTASSTAADPVMPSTLTTIGVGALGSNTFNLTVHLPDGITSYGTNNSFIHANAGDSNQVYCKSGTTTEATLKATGQEFLLEEYPEFYMKGSDGKYIVTKYEGNGGNITLPAPADTIGVNSYSSIFGAYGQMVTGLTIPDSITTLQGGAFGYLTNCTNIVIQSGNLTTLPSGVFADSPNATITIPDTVTTISGDPGGENALLIVGANSAAKTWAENSGSYTLVTDNSGSGKRYQIRAVTQPSISPVTVEMSTDSIQDVTVTKHDGSFVGGDGKFTFVGLKKNGSAVNNNVYSVSADTVVIFASYLTELGAGEHTITFDYDGTTTAQDGSQAAVDPELKITIKQMASPLLTVTGNEDADVTAGCTVVWKNGNTTLNTPISVPAGTALTYTITPGDALKVGSVQYYKETTGSVTLNTQNQAVNVALDQQGTVTVTPKDGDTAIPAEAYTVNWYTKSGETYTKVGTGNTSPMQDAGAKLCYEVVIKNAYKDDYPDKDKTEVTVAFGNTAQDAPLNALNNITLNISGTKRNGGAAITADDYTVTWYTKENDAFVSTGRTGNRYLGPTSGTDYYYEIAPKDRWNGNTAILNWLEFYGVPVSDSTKVTATDAAQAIAVPLAAVTTTTLTITVTNATQVGSGLTLSATQTPWTGYQSGASTFSYTSAWSAINTTLKNGNGSATVCKFDTTVKAEDTSGNFAAAYTTVKAAASMTASLTMQAEAIPEALPLTITRAYALRNDDNTATANLYYGSGDSQGDFTNMTFTLKKGDTVINSNYYTVTPTEVRFTDSEEIAKVVSMNDTLTLTAAFADGTQAIWTTGSSNLKITKKIDGVGFALAYSEYGRVYFTTTTNIRDLREAYGIYNGAGNLVDSGSGYTYSGGVTSGKLAAGTYTLAVWREEYCTTAPGTLTELNTRLANTGGYSSQSVTVANGKLTRAALGASPTGKSRVLFTADSGFTQETVETGLADWTLVKLNYAADTAVVPSGASYEITVTTFPNYWGTETAVLPRYEDGHTDTVKDKYISLYANDALVESTVKINTSNGGKIDGFTLYTTEPTGSIYFYVQALAGGEFNITAEGVVKNGGATFNGNGAMSKMTLVAKDGTQLCFTSDYLRTKDNGSGTNNGNGVWFLTAPNATTTLYMDGEVIATGRSNGSGAASFCFTMDWEKVGTQSTTAFWNDNHNWTLAGYHELYATATATVGGQNVTYRTATSVMECVTKQAFTPAEITKVTVTCHKEFMRGPSDFTTTLMEWNGTGAPAQTTWFWTPYRTGDECAYTFTATLEDGDKVLKTDEENYGLMLVATGEDGATYATMLERDGTGNTFSGTVSGTDFYFTNWSITIYSKSQRQVIQSDDFNAFLNAHKNEKILDPVTGNVVTVEQLYNNIKNEFTTYNITAADMQTAAAYKFDVNKDYLKALAKEFYGDTHTDEWWDSLDASAESMTELYKVFGYQLGDATEVDYASWAADTYSTTTLGDGRQILFKEQYTEKNGRVYYESWKVLTPKTGDEDKGQAIYQNLDLGSTQDSGILLTAANTSDLGLMLLGITVGSDPTPYNPNTYNPSKMWSMAKQAYQNATGNTQIAGDRSTWNVKSDYSNWNMRKSLTDDSYGTGAQQEYDRATRASAERYLEALKDAGSDQIGADNHKAVTDALDAINDYKDKYGVVNVDAAVDTALYNAQEALNENSGRLHDSDVNKLLQDLYDEANGVFDPTKDGNELADSLNRAETDYFGEKYKDAVNLLAKMTALQKALNNMGAQGNIFDGEGGINSRALKDPQGIVYEAVLSNPVQGATAMLYQKNGDTESQWNAADYGQVNPQTTGPDGQFQWFVPEGEWQVRVTKPADRDDLQDNTSSYHAAANLNDGSTAGWLPVMPVQMGINIPLVSTADPTVASTKVYKSYAEVEFSLYMDKATLADDTFTVTDSSGNVIPCTVSYPDEDADPTNAAKTYAKTVRLTPTSGSFDATKTYTVTAAINANAYNTKSLTQNYDSGALTVTSDLLTANKSSVSVSTGSTASVTLTLKNSSGDAVSNGVISAVSSATGVATVTATATTDASGQATFTITGVSAGSATITFTAGNASVTVTVSVTSGGSYNPGPGTVSPGNNTPGTAADTGNGELTVTAKANNGKAEATLNANDAAKAIQNVERGDTLTVKVNSDGVQNVALTLPASTTKTIADADVNLRVETAGGTVKLDADTLDTLAGTGKSAEISVSGDGDGTTTVNVTSGGQSVSANVKVELPATQQGQVVALVMPDGSEQIVKKSVVESGKAYAEIPAGATVKVIDNAKSFPDVAGDEWYAGSVEFVTSHELFQGTDKGFEPNATMNRAMLATVLYRLEGATAAGTNPFADVADDAWYAPAVIWASGAGIVTGTEIGFEPDKPVSREQIATMLYRYANLLGLDTSSKASLNGFRDGNEVSPWASDAMRWAVSVGLFQGDGNGALNPKNDATRAEVAAIIERMIKLIVK